MNSNQPQPFTPSPHPGSNDSRPKPASAQPRDLTTSPQPAVRIRVFHNANHAAMAFGYRADDRVIEVYAYDHPAVTANTTDDNIASPRV